MIFKNLILKNFKTYEDVVIDLNVSNANQNIVLISAMNGVGKTTILEAIYSILYGFNENNYKKYLNYIARDTGQYEIYLELNFEQFSSNEMSEVRVIRTYNVNEFNLLDKKDLLKSVLVGFKSTINVFINNELIIRNEEEWQDYINSNIPKEVSSFFFFNGEKIEELIDIKDPNKLRVAIEKILGIETIRNLKDGLSVLRSDVLKKLSQDNHDEKLKIRQVQLTEVNDEIEGFKTNLDIEREKVVSLNQRKIEIEDKINELSRNTLSMSDIEEINSLQHDIDRINKEITISEELLVDFKENLLDVYLFSGNFNNIKSQLELEKEDKRMRSFLSNENLEYILNYLFYPQCKHGGESIDKQKLIEIKEDLVKNLVNNNNSNIILDLSDSDEIKLLNSIHSVGMTSSKIDLNKVLDRLSELEYQKEKLKIKIEKIQEDNIPDLDYDNQINKLNEELRSVFEELSDSKSGILITEDKLNLKKAYKIEIENEIEKILARQNMGVGNEYLALLNKVIKIFEEYINILASEKKSLLERKTFEMFSKLSNSKKYSNIEIDEYYSIHLIDNGNYLKDELSAGQKQILVTSLLWGLSQASGVELPIVIDTPLARLDPLHRQNMLDYYFPEASHQVIILSQPSEIPINDISSSNFNRHLRSSSYIEISSNNENTAVEVKSFIN